VRKGGAAARMMLVQAAADELGVPRPNAARPGRDHPWPPAAAAPPTARWPPPPPSWTPPTDVPLKDPKDWKLAGKRLARLDTVDKTTGKPGLRHGPEAARHAQRRDQGLPGVRRQGQELRRRGGERARREEGGAVGDNAVAVVADTWWRAKTALDALPIEWDLGPHAGASRRPSRRAEARRWTADSAVGNRPGRRPRGAGRGAAPDRGGLQLPAPEPRHDGADERHRALDKPSAARSGRPTQNGEAALAATAEAAGLPPAQCEVYKLPWAAASAAAAPCTTGCARRC
jgi:isoquinoline 1-oxidoreductase beta subunit